MHTTVLPNIVTKLKTVLGTHIVNRNVLLSSSIDSYSHSNAYTWTTADATLMSIGQMTGTFASYNNKLPLFNYEDFKTSSNFWSRGVGNGTGAWVAYNDGSIGYDSVRTSFYVRPLIYIR